MQDITYEEVRSGIKKREPESHKGDYGHVLVVGGQKQMAGAALISVRAAVYSGAGLVTLASHPNHQLSLNSLCPEAMFVSMYESDQLSQSLEKASVVLIGPGLGRSDRSRSILQKVIEEKRSDQELVLDADAIDLYAQIKKKQAAQEIVFTPHPGEWQTLSGLAIEDQTEANNRREQSKLQATLVLKKHRTEIYFSNECYRNPLGTPAQATAGMGDCLAGMIAAFLAQCHNRKHAILSAVYLHSFIAERLAEDQYVVLPSQIIQEIPFAMKEFRQAD